LGWGKYRVLEAKPMRVGRVGSEPYFGSGMLRGAIKGIIV